MEFGMRTKEQELALRIETPLVHEKLLGFHVHILRKEKQVLNVCFVGAVGPSPRDGLVHTCQVVNN